jgi:dTMP kinase
MLITFEGIDGCGKSTQMDLVKTYLLRNGRADEILNTREPGFPNDDLAGLYRYLIVEANTSPIEKFFLLLADRARHFERFVRPVFYPQGPWKKRIILSDRGPDSTVAYQGFGQGLAPVPFILEGNRIAMQEHPIDLTIILDVDPEMALKRVAKKQYFERLGIDFFHRVRNGYLEIAKYEPKRVVVVNATQSKEETHKSILRVLEERLRL